MDLLFKRYASPFLIMDEMIKNHQMQQFIESLIKKENEQIKWEMWLHKIYNLNYSNSNMPAKEQKAESLSMTSEQVDEQVKKSQGILKKIKLN